MVKITDSASLDLQLVAAADGVMNKRCIDQERHSLLDFKAHLQDPKGTLATWSAEEDLDDCCQWRGVTCNNETGHVTELYLRLGSLEGEIRPSLFNLTYLTYLHLSYNSFNGTIPESIGSLSQLRDLHLSDNSLTGTIPTSIGNSLTELRSLDLSGNYFTGKIPSEFGNLTNLRYLSLGNLTNCTTENIDWLSHFYELQYLNMGGISLAKANNWVNLIFRLQNLSRLYLFNCELAQVRHPYSSSSSFVNSSSSIKTIDLRNNNLNSSMYHWLFPLTSNSLQHLYLGENMLDEIPKYLGNLCSLTLLSLWSNSLAIKFSDFLNNLSGCTSVSLQVLSATSNHLTGSLPDEIQNFTSLRGLNLNFNQLNGTISEKVWELPKLSTLEVSSNFLRGNIFRNLDKSKIKRINLSNNSLEGVPSDALMSNFTTTVGYVDLSSCKLGPQFPKWIQTLKNLTHLDISNNGISDTIPTEFWNMWPSGLIYLDLSANNISGKVPDLLSNFYPSLPRIDLSSNNFSGPIPNVPSTSQALNLSNNKFSGGISFLCQIVHGYLELLDLSNNSLSGHIPDCLWNFKRLKVLRLGHNNLSGKLPASLESLFELEVLYLLSNNLSGELPLSLRNCTNLNFLDLGANMFSGNVPVWIGENLSRLYALILTSNNFSGTIPLQLCQLVNLQILDLSMNNLYGTIPSCVNNLTTMVQEGFLQTQRASLLSMSVSIYVLDRYYFDSAMIKWQGNVREFSRTLGLLMSIDLSSNNLTGQIPYEVTNLYQLLALNLSNNALHGEIPQKIGQMKKLLTLDLSKNNFSGGIPSSMSQMISLNYLDVSYNNLSGRIPSSTQLQSFEPSRYKGNTRLCGPPTTQECLGEEIQVPSTVSESEVDGEVNDELRRWFYIGGASGFTAGFCIACSALLLNHRWRHNFFHFLDRLKDWVYVKVRVFIPKLQRVIR